MRQSDSTAAAVVVVDHTRIRVDLPASGLTKQLQQPRNCYTTAADGAAGAAFLLLRHSLRAAVVAAADVG